jgi:allophanate hydrolase
MSDQGASYGPGPSDGPSVADILTAHRTGAATPTATVARVADLIDGHGDDGTWITPVPRAELLAAAAELERRPGARTLPLYGVPFGVKDSIDVAGHPTTLACPDYAYIAEETAPVVQRLLDAGALYVGKTALDQFATGLNGTRTPYPIPRSVYGGDMICGGSSSGSARAVALGEVPFCVATDTAGSGRVPAALNGIIGWKPSRGLISTVGLVPACKSLDCITMMARTVDDLDRVFAIVNDVDERDPWARPRGPEFDGDRLRIGLPPITDLEFFGDTAQQRAHEAIRDALPDMGFRCVETTLEPFLAAGELLYQGPWVAERLVEFGDFLADHAASIVPVVREIFTGGKEYSAVDTFRAQHRLQELRARVGRMWADMDVLAVPTIGTSFTVEQVLADPISCNTVLGTYTHFGNLLDLNGIAIPMGTAVDGRPVSLMLLGPALGDDAVLTAAARALGEDRPGWSAVAQRNSPPRLSAGSSHPQVRTIA